MKKTIAIITTLDTKGEEASYLREQLHKLGAETVLIDIGVVGEPGVVPDITRQQIAEAGGASLESLLVAPSRQEASPIMDAGAIVLISEMVAGGKIDGIVGLGGSQGTSNCTAVMRLLPYGFPKIMVSTVASGDTSSFVDIKDITMMFSVGDILGLNNLMRAILANAAGAAYGMALVDTSFTSVRGSKPTIGMTNLGVLTDGAMYAMELLRKRGFEVIVFHAVGSGGRAMEQLMREGVIDAVFDYALGELADELFGGFRAGGAERLTVGAELGLPQIIVPGGAEHIGLFVEPDSIPPQYEGRPYTFHNPIIYVPRLNASEMKQLAEEIANRLSGVAGQTKVLLPLRGVGRYSVEGGPLYDPECDQIFIDHLKSVLPQAVDVIEIDAGAEDPVFIEACVDELCALVNDA